MTKRPMRSVLCGLMALTAIHMFSAAPAAAQLFGSFGANSVYDVQSVRFPSRYRRGEIIVSFGDRRLYHVTARGQATSYPIAVPRPQSRWQGVLRVAMKRKNPDWVPTPKMRRENPKLPSMVRGGDPRNPLGVRALYLGNTLYRIHGTDAPWTIGKNVSKGCIRMHNDHVVELYRRVGVGARVTATWKRFSTRTISASASTGSTSSSGNWQRNVFGLN